ncbi:MAG: carbohydrate ABC transporter permease [Butyrivibrio sp.]|nr:carbohydrate ABC transporter permease [Butyrivibrio sp.]
MTVTKAVFLTLILIWTVFPILWMFSLAFKRINIFGNFIDLFADSGFGQAVVNSIKVTGISLAIGMLLGIPCAYIMAKKHFTIRYKSQALFLILLIRILPPITFAIPLYTLMNRLGLMNTNIPILTAHTLLDVPLIIWFLISFFSGLPVDIEESARIDGASEFRIFGNIELPLVAPGIAAATMLSLMTSWNEYLYGVIFVQSPTKFTIPLVLATMNSEQELAEWGKIAAGGIISMIPVMMFVVFAQNYLITGLSSGAVKE